MIDRRARAVNSAALVSLKSVLDEAASPGDFLIAADNILGDPQYILDLPFDYGPAEKLEIGDGRVGQDINNGPAVFEYLGVQDPSNASDPRLWTYLAFGTYREYMEERWPLDTIVNWKGRVEDRWLLLNAGRGDLIRHGIARLWWVSSLTYDGRQEYPLAVESSDPFAYTKAAFRNEDRVIGLFDREAGSVRSLVRAVLEYATTDSKSATDGRIRALMKEVTLVYGFRELEVLTDVEIRQLVRDLAPPE